MTDISIKLEVTEDKGRYWTIKRVSNSNDDPDTVFENKDSVKMVLVNDYVMGSMFSSLGSMGITGLYVTVVLAIGRVVRGMFEKVSQRVYFFFFFFYLTTRR